MEDGQRRVEETLLGGEPRWTRHQVVEQADVSLDLGRRLWRALGFADVGDDLVAFTEGDVGALRDVMGLVRSGVLDEGELVDVTRALGQSLSRLAEWQVGVHAAALARAGDLDTSRAVAATEEALPVLERLLVHVWRRHLAAAAGRLLAIGPDELDTRTLTVGFADLVGFTSLTRRLSEEDLGRLVERFEAAASDVVAEHGGRVVKTIGDEVMFVVDEVAAAPEIGLLIAEGPARDLPQVRVGMACGTVVARLGDVYGEPVNLASRLTSLARPGSVLVDRQLAAALDGASRYVVKRLHRTSVRGYSALEPWLLRRRVASGTEVADD